MGRGEASNWQVAGGKVHRRRGTPHPALAQALHPTSHPPRVQLHPHQSGGTPRPDWSKMQQLAGGALMVGLGLTQEAEHCEAASQRHAAPRRDDRRLTRGADVSSSGGGEGRRPARGGSGGATSSGEGARPASAARPLDKLSSSRERVAATGAALVHVWKRQREVEAYLPQTGPFFVAWGVGPDVPCYLRWSGAPSHTSSTSRAYAPHRHAPAPLCLCTSAALHPCTQHRILAPACPCRQVAA